MPSAHEALIHLMVITSASDRDMAHLELERIGSVAKNWPIFIDFDADKLVDVAQDCQLMLQEEDGMDNVMMQAAKAIPAHLHDTAYAAAVEVAAVDMEMRLEEVRVLALLRKYLSVDPLAAAAIERATKARHKMLT